MAKTRIKTTPTRMQKEALMASAAVTTTTNIVTEHVFKKRISVLKNSITAKETTVPIQSTIIVQPPKRTNSISSTTSTASHTSESTTRSCAESPPPNNSCATTQNNGPTMDELTESAIKTLNAGLLAKSNALALKNRKVYMITEKCDDTSNAGHLNGGASGRVNGAATGQKRKMYLIMEEKEGDKNYAEKVMKTENTNGSKKLTLFTDTTNGQLPQKIEKILPEILNCIQAKQGGNAIASSGCLNSKTEILTPELNGQGDITPAINKDVNLKLQMKIENTERLPVTLPPKKNRTKIITTQIIPVNPSQHAILPAHGIDNWAAADGGVLISDVASSIPYVSTNNTSDISRPEKTSGATPVIVNASTLVVPNHANGSVVGNGLKSKENNNKTTVNQLHKNINLSTDFLFLMKMLPKLESIEEPHKNYVKTCIEDVVNKYASNQNDEP